MLRRKRFVVVLPFVLAAAALVAFPATVKAGEAWKPTRTVTIYCWSSPGGFTDLCNRALAASFSEQFGIPFNVTNMLGGGGGTAANHVYNQPRDGYSILGASDAMHALGIRGAFSMANDVWDVMFLINAKGVISVRADSPYKTLDDLVKAAKAEKMKVGASQAGNVWGVKLAQFNKVTGTSMTVLPYEGSSQTLIGLLSNEIDIALCGLAEQEDYIRAGKIRPLAMIEPGAYELKNYGRIPSIAESYPEFLSYKMAMQWGGIALPADMPKEILDAYHAAFQTAVNSAPVQDFSKNRNVDIINVTGQDAKKLVADNDSVFAWIIYDSGLAVKSPKEFGIPRP